MDEQEAKEILNLNRTHPLIGYNVSLPDKKGKPGRRYLEVRPQDETHFHLNWVNLKESNQCKAAYQYEKEAALFYLRQCGQFGESVMLWSCMECCPKEILHALKDVSSGLCKEHYEKMKAEIQALQKQ